MAARSAVNRAWRIGGNQGDEDREGEGRKDGKKGTEPRRKEMKDKRKKTVEKACWCWAEISAAPSTWRYLPSITRSSQLLHDTTSVLYI